MRKSKYLLGTVLAVWILSACGSQSRLTMQEQLDKGVSLLNEAKYEEAITALSKAAASTEANAELYRVLAKAYQEMGENELAADALLNVLIQEERTAEDVEALNELLSTGIEYKHAVVLAQMAYSQTGNREFFQTIFQLNAKNRNFDAMQRDLHELLQMKIVVTDYLKDVLQLCIDEIDGESVHKLAELLVQEEFSDNLINVYLAVELWDTYFTSGEDAVFEAMERYYADGRPSFRVNADTDFYVGEYDENGLRSGYGVCIYKNKTKTNSRIYMGFWEKGLRSGEGCAFRYEDDNIRCTWNEDYPSGDMTICRYGETIKGTLEQGHVNSPINVYKKDTLTAIHGIPDAKQNSGYAHQFSYDMERGFMYGCEDVERHDYCWDCIQEEGEGN